MDAHYLHDFFHPRGLLLIAGEESGRFLADRIQKNILEGGFRGPFLRRSTREFLEPYPVPGDWIERLSGPPLALIACHPLRVPEVLEACRGPGIRSAVVFSGEVIAETGDRRKFEQEISRAARGVGLRLLGPNCPGIQRPRIGLNATFGLPLARPGGVALVSQSGAISTTILDQYSADHLGFSAVVSPGDAVDTDFGDILNFLATDIETRSILLYMEGVHHARNFLSGLRLAARIKPVIIVKSGRHEIGSLAARHHTGAPLGMDPVFNAALERSGAVRAFSLEQLLSAAEILSSSPRLQGDRLGILTNGGGPGVLAADRAADLGVQIPSLSPETFAENDPVFPEIWTPSNPLDLHFDADADRYARALEATLEDPALDGILILYAPRQNSSAEETSRSLVKVVQEKPGKPVLVSLMGEKGVQNARRILMDQQIPCFPFPEAAVDAFSYLARYWRNQQLLAQLPASGPEGAEDSPADIAKGREILHSAILVNRGELEKEEILELLAAFRIRCDFSASLPGTGKRKLRVGLHQDPVFGPVINFGGGGKNYHARFQQAVALPPLNRFIIGQLLARTRGARHLEEGYPVEELHNLLLRISEMICELPELETMDLNPLVVTEKGLRIQDGVVHIRKTPIDAGRYSHMAIHPYPTDLERMVTLPAGEKIQIRPIRPEDAAREQDFVRGLSSESRYFRFLQAIRELSPEALVRFTQIDYDREMALVALVPDEDGKEKQIGVARYTMAPDDRTCDFAIVIADEWKGRGLGTILMEALMEAARSRGLQEIQGDVLQDNGGMLHLMKKLGFQKKSSREDPSLCLVTRNLQSS